MKKILKNLNVKIFADGADKAKMIELSKKDFISGLTTNPTLMRKSGIVNYKDFAQSVLSIIKDKPISFEVFSDDFDEMYKQALEIASWASNVYVKIPITNTKGTLSADLIKELAFNDVKVNVTAIMTNKQVEQAVSSLNSEVPSYISVFAGRIADTGVDPIPIMIKALESMKQNNKSELIWASPRELLNIIQANEIGCHVITVTSDILKKLVYLDYDLNKFSLDTVKMFYEDSVVAGYKI